MSHASSDGLLDLLHPAWQVLIAGCLVVVLVMGVRRLVERGPTRMANAMLVTALLIVALTVVTALASQIL